MISDQIKTGVDRAPHRSLLYALGLTEEELSRSLIAVVSAQSDIIPGHVHLDKIAEAVKAGAKGAFAAENRKGHGLRIPSGV